MNASSPATGCLVALVAGLCLWALAIGMAIGWLTLF